MGEFYGSVYLAGFMSHADTQTLLTATAHALTERLGAEGYLPAAEGSEAKRETEYDRQIRIEAVSDKWIAVYDRLLDDQDLDEMSSLLKGLSADLQLPAVGVSIYDSDILTMQLARQGRIADTAISDIELFNDLFHCRRKRKVQAVKWTDLWKQEDANAKNEFMKIWSEERDEPAESLLNRVEASIDIPAWAVARNFDDASADNHAGKQTMTLRFRHKDGPLNFIREGGPSRLRLGSYQAWVTKRPGTPFALNNELVNEGIAFAGLRIRIWGSALEGDRAKLDRRLELRKYARGSYNCEILETEMQPAEFTVQDRRVNGYTAVFPEFEFPAGCEVIRHAATARELTFQYKQVEKRRSPSVHIVFQLTAPAREMRGELELAFIPIPAPEGAAELSVPVRITTDSHLL